MRSIRHDLVDALVVILIFTAVGMGPLHAMSAVADGFLNPEDPGSLGASSPLVYWLAIVIIGHFFGWTLTGLAVDYEAFWRLPGRLRAFEALVAAAGPGSVLHVAANERDGAMGALRYRRLRSICRSVLAEAPLTFVYVAVRGAWLASGLAGAGAVVELVRTLVAGEAIGASALALAVSVLVFLPASLLTRTLGAPAARQAVRAIETNAAGRRAG